MKLQPLQAPGGRSRSFLPIIPAEGNQTMLNPIFLAAILCPVLLLAAIRTEPASYSAGGVEMTGTLVYDDALAAKPAGVLVFPEWWGANDYPKGRARMLAELGYAAFVADMYGGGKSTTDAKEAGTLAGGVYSKPEVMVERAKAALEAFKKTGKVDEGRIAAIGYCMGGTVALHLARAGGDIRGVVAFHAGLANRLNTPNEIKAKILVCNGAADKLVSDEETAKFKQEMADAKADWELILYGNAMHAFTNPNADNYKALGSLGYNAEADKRSWENMRLFLTECLGKGR
jgi:dienelactone hydrolase